jgi:hypothetical protein
MSDIGLYGSIYEQLRNTADHIDRALVNLRSPTTADRARSDLADLLAKITDTQSTDPEVRFLAVILKQEPPGLPAITALTKALRQRAPSKAEVLQLEQLALSIDKECASTLARIKGRR